MANILKRSLNLFLCLALVLSMMSAVTLTAAAEGTTELLLNKTYAKLKVNENETLALKAVLKNGTAYSVADVTWKSTEEGVATVSNGTVTPVAEGTTLITATTADGIVAKCTVDVYDSRLYFEERWIKLQRTEDGKVEYDPSANLKGTIASDATVTYLGGRNVANGEMTSNGVKQEPMTYDAEKKVYKTAYNGLAKFTATATVNGETIKAESYVTVGDYGADLVNTLQLAYQGAAADRNSNQFFWKMGYMNNNVFMPYTNYNQSFRGFNVVDQTNAKGGVFLVKTLAHVWTAGSANDSVIVWKAPKTGTVKVNRGVAYNAYIRLRNDKDSNGNTIVADEAFSATLTVSHEGNTLYSRTFTGTKDSTQTDITSVINQEMGCNAGTATYSGTVATLKNLNVKKGDEIYFVLSAENASLRLNQSFFSVTYTNTIAETETTFGVAEDEISLAVGEEGKTLTGTDVVSYVSSNTDIAKVDENGNISAGSEGEAVIYAFNADGSLADYCTVTVNNWGIPAISGSTVSIEAKSEAVKDSAVIVAVKSGDVLKKAYVAALENDTFTASNVEIADGDSVTVFLWESLTTLKPLKAAIPVAVN